MATVSAERGSPDAIAWCTAEGWGLPADRVAAIALMTAALDDSAPMSSPYTMCRLAELLGKTDPSARELLARAALEGCALGHHGLAVFGDRAVHMQRAADLGHADARCTVATMLDFGELSQTAGAAARAGELYILAAQQGETTAMYNLSMSYTDGSCGLEVDAAAAARWMLAAAQAGDVAAQARYGRMCMTGTGVTRDERCGRTCLPGVRPGRRVGDQDVAYACV